MAPAGDVYDLTIHPSKPDTSAILLNEGEKDCISKKNIFIQELQITQSDSPP